MTSAVPALGVSDLGFAVGGAVIVDGVTFEVARGELVTIIGPNGAGKTSLFNLISGLYRPTAGRIELLGREVTGEPRFRRARLGLGRTFQTSSVFPALSVLENVRLGVQARAGGSLQPWRLAGRDGEAVDSAREALEAVGLARLAGLQAGLLAHGDKRKLEVAILLGGRFEVLLLDEPTAGVAVEDVPELMRLIASLREAGKTVLMVEHRMDLVIGLSDRIAVMHQGRLLTIEEPAKVIEDPAVQEAYLGMGAKP